MSSSEPRSQSPDPANGSKPKRPGSGSRHGSSWVARLHRRHDTKHHTEHRALLSDDNPDSDVEAQEEPTSEHEPGVAKLRSCGAATVDMLKVGLVKVQDGSTKVYQMGRKHGGKVLATTSLILLVLLIATLISFLAYHKKQTQKEVCTSPACVHAASELLHAISPDYVDIDACENFDVLACQGFEDRHDLRPDQGDMFRGTIMAEDAETTLRHILEADISEIDSADRANFDKLKANYDACMDESTIKDYGLKPLKAVVEHVKMFYSVDESQNWRHSPVLQSSASKASAADKTLDDVLLYLNKIGVSALVSVGVGADDKEPDDQIVFASPISGIGLPSKEYYEDNQTLSEYQEMMNTVLGSFFEKPDNSSLLNFRPVVYFSAADLAKSVVDFEVKLAAATPPEEELLDITKSYNKLSVAEVDSLLPHLSLKKLIGTLGPSDYNAKSIIVASPSFMKKLSALIDATPKDTIQAFLVWKTVQSYASRIEDPALLALTRFNNKMQGKEPDAKPDRWRRCLGAADRDLGWILSKFFVDKAFSVESKDFGDQIVLDIKGSFVDFLNVASWMTPDNRDRAIKKVHAIDQKIGYPTSNPDILDPTALQKYYKGVSIRNTTFFENAIQVAQFETRQEWSRLGKPTRHDSWEMTASTVNAYYNPAGNEIVFPAGIMQSPVFYDPSVPQYLSYGAFGAISGHELSHAFDNTGSQYDESGRYVDWWSNETREAFEEKTSCFVNQYAKFTVTGPDDKDVHVNGNLTLGENVADAGGVHAAFVAWRRREVQKPGKLLPGLEHFTKEQLFFINYAQFWCGKTTKATALRRIYTDPHAPKNARILGTMANSEDFRKAFNCPSKQPTCELW